MGLREGVRNIIPSKKHDLTLSALAVCEVRAIGRGENKESLKNPDYLAEYFLPWTKKMKVKILRLPFIYASYKKRIEKIAPGGFWFFQVRTRFFDDFLKRSLQRQFQQIVILGAGNDSRAIRYQKRFSSEMKFFEVDHPLTQKKKQIQLESSPFDTSHIEFVALDFNHETQFLEQKLEERGFKNELPTLFLWKGGAYYFSPEVVEEVLSCLRRLSSQRSELAFDYLLRGFLHGDYSTYGSEKLAKGWDQDKEKIQFGLNQNEVESFLKALGWQVLEDYSARELEKKYLSDRDGLTHQRKIHGCFRMLTAKFNEEVKRKV